MKTGESRQTTLDGISNFFINNDKNKKKVPVQAPPRPFLNNAIADNLFKKNTVKKNEINKKVTSGGFDLLNDFKKNKNKDDLDLEIELEKEKREYEASKPNKISNDNKNDKQETEKNINELYKTQKKKESKLGVNNFIPPNKIIEKNEPKLTKILPPKTEHKADGSFLLDHFGEDAFKKSHDFNAVSKNKKLESLLVGVKHRTDYDEQHNYQSPTVNLETLSGSKLPDSFLQKSKLNDITAHIGPIRSYKREEDEYRYFKFSKEEILQKVLDFNFYRDKHKTITGDHIVIPNNFSSHNHYKYVWINNFFYELKYSLIGGKIENSLKEKYIEAGAKIKFMSKNDFIDNISSFNVNFNKNLDFQKLKIFKDNDIFAIYRDEDFIKEKERYKENNLMQEENKWQNLAKNKISYQFDFENKKELPYFLGIISYEKTKINENINELIFKILNKSANELTDNYYSVQILGNLTTSLREYNAILEMENYPLTQLLLNPFEFHNKKLFEKSNNSLNNHAKKYIHNIINTNKFNESQKEAIKKVSTMSNRDAFLIQGPPGTGKTHTIIGIISLILIQNPNSKILICAPSNAAIDEISLRIAKKGILNENLNSSFHPFIRFGFYDRLEKESKELNTETGKFLQKFSIEKLVESKYAEREKTLLSKLEKLKFQLDEKDRENDKLKKEVEKRDLVSKDRKNEILKEIRENEEKKKDLIGQIKSLKMEKKMNSQDKKIYERDLLETNRILCTTLNSAGNERLKIHNVNYEYVIIDEACQSVETSSIIPFNIGAEKVIMVGDHMQLPATVFSDKATYTKYNRSLFERLIDNKYPSHLLTTQYRMERNIREFVGKTFYDNKLRDDSSIIKELNNSSLYSIINRKHNFSFFDLKYSKEKFLQGSKSYLNDKEVNFVINLLKAIQSSIDAHNKNVNEIEIDYFTNFSFNPNYNKNAIYLKYAIITPYKAQVKVLTEEISKQAPNILENVEINTVDSFQGREQDIVIISTVRSNFNDQSTGGIGFLNDYRRMNVALSRAKLACFIVGNSDTLIQNEYWQSLIDHCISKSSIFPMREEYLKDNNCINNLLKHGTININKEDNNLNGYEDGEIINDYFFKDVNDLKFINDKYKNIFNKVKNDNQLNYCNTSSNLNAFNIDEKMLGKKKQKDDSESNISITNKHLNDDDNEVEIKKENKKIIIDRSTSKKHKTLVKKIKPDEIININDNRGY